MARTLAPLDGW